jgi:hypothetical protein
MSKRSSRVVRAAVLLPVLLFSLAATSYATWRCRMDGIARTECCCPKDATGTPETETPAIGAPECCVVERHRIETAPTDISRGGPHLVGAALAAFPVAILPPLPAAAADPRIPVDLEPARPPGGRALVVQKHAFLI